MATILLNVAAGAYGDAAIAGMSIVTRISMFINAFLIGFGQGFQPVCGFNYGAGPYARVRQGFWFCVKVGFFFCWFVRWQVWDMPRRLFHLPQGRPCCCSYRCGSIALAVHHLSVGCMDCGQQHDAADYPQARTRYDTFLCPSRAVLHPLIFILPYFLGLKGVEMCQAASDMLTFFLAIPLTCGVLAEMKRKEAEQLQQRQS